MVDTDQTKDLAINESSTASAQLDKALRRKQKKLRKQIAKGVGPNSTTVALLSEKDEKSVELAKSLFESAVMSFQISDRTFQEEGMSVRHIQRFLNWFVNQGQIPQSWFVFNNKLMVGNVVVLLLKGLTWHDWMEAMDPESSPKRQLLFLPSLEAVKLVHRRGRSWNPWVRHIERLDHALLRLRQEKENVESSDSESDSSDSETEDIEDSYSPDKSGKKRSRPKAGFTTDLGKKVLEMCMVYEELEAHYFPLAFAQEQKEWDITAPGRVAGYPDHCCNLFTLEGYLMTRTAHRDLHAVLGHADACPVMQEEAERIRSGSLHAPFEVGKSGLPRILSVDCEMCEAGEDTKQLARVSIVNANETTLVDELVIPEKPVTNYLTEFSGVTKELLSTAKYSLNEIQSAIADILDGHVGFFGSASPTDPQAIAQLQPPLPSACVVGHSIDNDLHSLRIIHTRVLDTSILYPHPAGLPYRHALRFLASSLAGMMIQQGSNGHDSVEDCTAALRVLSILVGSWKLEYQYTVPPPRRLSNPDPSSANPKETTGPVVTLLPDTPLFASFFFGRSGRAKFLPASWEFRKTQTETTVTVTTAATSQGSSITGLAGVIEQFQTIEAQQTTTTTTIATTPNAFTNSTGGNNRVTHLFDTPAFLNKKQVRSTYLIGSDEFLRNHTTGKANAKHATTFFNTQSMHHIRDTIINVVKNLHESQLAFKKQMDMEADMGVQTPTKPAGDEDTHPGGTLIPNGSEDSSVYTSVYGGVNFVFSQLFVPTATTDTRSKPYTASMQDKPLLKTLDQVLSGLVNNLPRGTMVVGLSQASNNVFSNQAKPGSKQKQNVFAMDARRLDSATLEDATKARAGVAFFHIKN